MMITMAEILRLSDVERAEMQKGFFRELSIGMWAPFEPQIMKLLLNTLGPRKLFSRQTTLKIIDRLISMSIYTQVATYGEMVAFIKSIPDDFTIACGPCACRKNTLAEAGNDARDLAAGKFDFCQPSPLNLDIQFGESGDKFMKCDGYRPISKPELLELEKESRNMGLVSNMYVMAGGEGSICHCSSATCVPLIVYNNLHNDTARVIKKGGYISVTDSGACDITGNCAKVCHFGAREIVMRNGTASLQYHPSRCYGCGLCEAACQNNAVSMAARSRHEAGQARVR